MPAEHVRAEQRVEPGVDAEEANVGRRDETVSHQPRRRASAQAGGAGARRGGGLSTRGRRRLLTPPTITRLHSSVLSR